MKKIVANVLLKLVFLIIFLFVCGGLTILLAEEEESQRQPNDKVAFKLMYYKNSPLKKKFDKKVIDDFSGMEYISVSDDLNRQEYLFKCVTIQPPDFEWTDDTEEAPILRPVTWGEFYRSRTYLGKRWTYADLEISPESFPVSFAEWKLDYFYFKSGFDIRDAQLKNCIIYAPTLDKKGNEANNKHFELFASTWNYKNNCMDKIGLNGFDLRKASFKNMSTSSMGFLDSLLHDENYPNVELFENTIISATKSKLLPKSRGGSLPYNISKEQFYRTKNYREKDLCEMLFIHCKITDFDLSGQNLTNANFNSDYDIDLASVNFTDAIIEGAAFAISHPTKNFTAKQLYSTHSYKQGSLTNIKFKGRILRNGEKSDMQNWKFTRKNLTGCEFTCVDLKDADFTDAVITNVCFTNNISVLAVTNLTIDQIKSTWNYKVGNMDGILLPPEIQKILDAEKETKNDMLKLL
ncbi:MAG: pentapeptide repeat-containing protein [Planctomycetaceae bacterium]|jgi:uncharacterized protein YjbI with pentapeptide repeats|nr:pentapeptide repeat-containing protein [Planctomycetaceae bacterium]